MFGFLALVFSIYIWCAWYSYLIGAFAPLARSTTFWVLGITPVFCFSTFAFTISRFAVLNVTSDPDYFLGYIALCLLTLSLTMKALEGIGIHPLQDALERANPACLPPIVGGLLGMMLLNVGSNLGGGEEEYTTLFPLFAGGAAWLVFGAAFSNGTSLIESITVRREHRAGWFFGLVWFSSSIPLARASAGDWFSFKATMIDLLGAIPALLILVGASRWWWMVNERSGTILSLIGIAMVCVIVAAASFAMPLASTW